MNKAITVILREYLVVVKKKSFIVMTLLTPALFIGIIVLQAWLAGRDEKKTFAIVDRTGLDIPLALAIKRNNPIELVKGRSPYIFQRIDDTPESIEKTLAQIRDKKGDLAALIIVPKDAYTGAKVEYHAKTITDHQTQGWLTLALQEILIERRLQARKMKRPEIRTILRDVELDLIDVTGKKEGELQRTIIGYGSFLMLYMMISIYGSMIMNGFIEDKSSRVMEVMLSSTSARQLLLGKVIGIGLTSLTQLAIWVALLIGAAQFKPAWFFIITTAPKSAFAFTLVYFMLGYAVYALMFAAIGAMVTNLRDAQQLSLPIFMPVLLTMAMMPAVLRDPDGGIALALSLIPLTSPISMPATMGLATLPPWQIALSIGILLLSIPVIYLGAVKLFRISILNQGKAPTARQVWEMLRSREA